MKRPRLYTLAAAASFLGVLAAAATFFSSFKFQPDPVGDASFIARAQQKLAPGISVLRALLARMKVSKALERILRGMASSLSGSRLKTRQTSHWYFSLLHWIKIITHPTRLLTGSTACCLLPPTGRATNSFLSVRCQVASHLIRLRPASFTEY